VAARGTDKPTFSMNLGDRRRGTGNGEGNVKASNRQGQTRKLYLVLQPLGWMGEGLVVRGSEVQKAAMRPMSVARRTRNSGAPRGKNRK